MHTAVLHPTNMQRLIATTLDEGRSRVDAEDRSRWEAIASGLALSEEQVSQLQALRLIFLRRMAKVSQERSGIVSRLHMVTIPDRMMALQSVIAETLKARSSAPALLGLTFAGWLGRAGELQSSACCARALWTAACAHPLAPGAPADRTDRPTTRRCLHR